MNKREIILRNTNNGSLESSLFVDYKAVELKIGTQWLLVYYVKNQISKEMQRFRVVVPIMKSKSERIKHGKNIKN